MKVLVGLMDDGLTSTLVRQSMIKNGSDTKCE